MTSSLSYRVGQTLTWVPTAALKARYDLITSDNTTLATLDMSSWTSKANARVPEGTLFLHKEGWSGLKVAIYSVEQGPLLATYQRKWTGTSGQLLFPDGREFRWGKVNFWGTQKAWTNPAGKTAYVQLSVGGFSRKSSVIIHPQAAEIPELSLLLVLGLYNILIERRDAAAASSSASV
jgi:hypothetical protein